MRLRRGESVIRFIIVAQDGRKLVNNRMAAQNVKITFLNCIIPVLSSYLDYIAEFENKYLPNTYLVQFIFTAICKIPCKNNGKCVKPEQCSCPIGYTGRHCELDVNECETEKPCDQMCYNTEGSFYCTCRLGFILHSDRQSCKKIDSSFGNDDTGTAFEARDLENDVDSDNDLATRINSIEKVCGAKKKKIEIGLYMYNDVLFAYSLNTQLSSIIIVTIPCYATIWIFVMGIHRKLAAAPDYGERA